jgi:HlyD family secretion protein
VNWKRWLWIVLTAAVVIAALAFGFRAQPVEVESAAIRRGPMQVTVEEDGKTRLRNRYVISTPVAGYARRLRWKAGDRIQSGDVVAVLEPLRADVLDPRSREQTEARVRAGQATLAAAESRIATLEEQARSARVDLDYWRRQLQREEKLRASGDVPAERVDRSRTEAQRAEASVQAAEASIRTARAEVEAARADLESSRAALRISAARPQPAQETVTVRAPVSGRVLAVAHESEGVVTSGQPLLDVGDARALEVEVEVLSADAVRMHPGGRVVLTRWGGDQPLEARIRLIEPSAFTKISALGVEEQRVRVIADITSPEQQWRSLGDGYRVDARFILWEGSDILQAPASSLFRHESGWAVFAIEGNTARRRMVEIGHRTGLSAEITGGLEEGDLVIPHPDDKVSDGAEIKVRGS